ncbi:MAG: phosphatase PAP2 family protein [Candidatus Eisenbacteria sp.]|nr:phosphatase PAP2 family protein [Candidatus Eisenbacteria bacterium]
MISQLVAIDTVLFALLNTKLTHPVLDSVMPFVTEQENWYPVLIGLWLALVIWGGRRGRMAAMALVIAVALTDQISCSIIKPLVGRVRPCNALSPAQCRLLVGRSSAMSFPSAHAANSFAMATVASWRFSRFAPLFYLVAVAVAYSRVYVGVHYPLDSLAGAVLGALLGRLAIWLVVGLRRRWDRWWEVRTMDRKRSHAAGA